MHEPLNELDHPFYDVVNRIEEQLRDDPNLEFYIKWSCENCKSRQTFMEPNLIYKKGKCEECGHTTDLTVRGINYLMIMKF